LLHPIYLFVKKKENNPAWCKHEQEKGKRKKKNQPAAKFF